MIKEIKKSEIQIVIPIVVDTYLAVVKNSVGSSMFRQFFAKVDGQPLDILRNGELSCAYFVSAILYLFQFIKKPHTTVTSTVKDMEENGWVNIKEPKVGSVLVWEGIESKEGENHKHIGFYVGESKAISNSSRSGRSVEHHWTFGIKNGHSNRKVENIYWNNKLNN